MSKIFLSAAEASSDLLSAKIIAALNARTAVEAGKIDVFGIGGAHLERAGMRVVISREELSVMGFWDVLMSLPKIVRALGKIKRRIAVEKPDLAVLVDYPGFHFRLARFLFLKGIPIVYLIPPKVWVWKRHRIAVMAGWVRKVLCIFPFEVDLYRSNGIDSEFIGNPIIEGMPYRGTQGEARTKLGIPLDKKVLLLMPGSRSHEVKMNLPLMLQAASAFADLNVVIVASDDKMQERIQSHLKRFCEVRSRISVIVGDSQWAMLAADVGLIKSGTSTLEAGLMRLPHVVLYKVSWLSEMIVRYLVRFHGPFGLVNLALGGWENAKPRVKEFVGHSIPVEHLTAELDQLFNNHSYRSDQLQRLNELREVFIPKDGISPADRGAQQILSILNETGSTR